MKATERLSSDIIIIFWKGKIGLVFFYVPKSQLLYLSTRHNFENIRSHEVGRFVSYSPIYLPPLELVNTYKGLGRPCMKYASHILEASAHMALLDRIESKAFLLICSPPRTDFSTTLLVFLCSTVYSC